jgi:hypothetical protein
MNKNWWRRAAERKPHSCKTLKHCGHTAQTIAIPHTRREQPTAPQLFHARTCTTWFGYDTVPTMAEKREIQARVRALPGKLRGWWFSGVPVLFQVVVSWLSWHF